MSHRCCETNPGRPRQASAALSVKLSLPSGADRGVALCLGGTHALSGQGSLESPQTKICWSILRHSLQGANDTLGQGVANSTVANLAAIQ